MLEDAAELTVEVAEGRAGPAIPGVLNPEERLRLRNVVVECRVRSLSSHARTYSHTHAQVIRTGHTEGGNGKYLYNCWKKFSCVGVHLRRGLLKSPSNPTDLRLARLLTLALRPLAIVSFREV